MYQTQCVNANGQFSGFLPVTQSVSQGSILGPFLFSLFINDISNSILFSNDHIYADDVQLYLSGSEDIEYRICSQPNKH
jgi:Reverse transcriptase (RNA-dependent DNA polymerase)